MSLVQVYAPIYGASLASNEFYAEVQEVISTVPRSDRNIE